MPRATAATTPRTTQAAASPLARSPACAVPACRQRRTCFSLRSRASPTETACSANTTFSAAAPVSPRAPEGCQRARTAGAVAGAAGGVPLDFLGSVVASGSMRALATPDRTPAAAMAATGARRAEGRRWAAGFGLGRRRPSRSVGRGTAVARFVSVCFALPSCACPLCPFGGGPLRRVAQPAVFPARPRAPAAAAAARRPLSVGLRARPWGGTRASCTLQNPPGHCDDACERASGRRRTGERPEHRRSATQGPRRRHHHHYHHHHQKWQEQEHLASKPVCAPRNPAPTTRVGRDRNLTLPAINICAPMAPNAAPAMANRAWWRLASAVVRLQQRQPVAPLAGRMAFAAPAPTVVPRRGMAAVAPSGTPGPVRRSVRPRLRPRCAGTWPSAHVPATVYMWRPSR